MSWFDEYIAVCEHDNTSPLYKRFAAVFTLAAAVQRRCYVMSLNDRIYLNLFILLVGPSAAGKGVAMKTPQKLLSKLDQHYIAPASVTTASMVDELEDALVTFTPRTGAPIQFNPLTVIAREFGVFLPAYDPQMMNVLQDLFDNFGYEERRRGKGKKVTIEKAMLNLMGGCTPAYLANTLPEGAWAEGLMSRMITVYSGPMPFRDIVEEIAVTTSIDSCRKQLERLTLRSGRIEWTTPALQRLNAWNRGGRKPFSPHPKPVTYESRRNYNAMKISALSAIANDRGKILEEDLDFALNLLFAAEEMMPESFKAMRNGGEAEVVKELLHFMRLKYTKTGKGVSRHVIMQFLIDKLPSWRIEPLLNTLQAGKWISAEVGGTFIPRRLEQD